MASETHNLTFHQMQMFFEDWAVDVAQYGELTEEEGKTFDTLCRALYTLHDKYDRRTLTELRTRIEKLVK